MAGTGYAKTLKWAEKNRNANTLFIGYVGSALVYEHQQDYEKAKEYFSKAVALVENMRASLNPSQRANFYDVKVGGFYRSEPANGLTRVNMKLNQSMDSIASSEVTRARAFTDNISNRSARGYSGVPAEVSREEEQLVERVAGLRQSRNKIDVEKNPEAYDTVTKEIEKAERELNTFVDSLWKNYEPYAAVKYPRPVKLKDAAIRPDENLLIFDVVGEGVGVKLIRGKEILTTFYVKWDMKDLERSVKKFLEPFEKFDLKGFDPNLAQVLFKRLVGRALYEVPEGTPITIIPDGVLATLPFEALVMGGTAHWVQGPKGYCPEGIKFLGDAYPINYYQSITALHLARTLGQTIKPSRKMLVLADPVFETDDSRLKAEARAKERETFAPSP